MADTASRIWYQSFVDEREQANYIGRLRLALADYADPGFDFAVHGISPPDRYLHPLTEFRCAGETIRAALAAEADGCDAFVIGHFQEPGLIECRGSLDIPVIGLGESVMLYACALGRKIGLVTINPVFIPWHDEQIARHGLGQRIVGVRAIDADVATFMRAFEDETAYAQVKDEFCRQVRPLIEQGVEVVVPAGGLPMLLFARERDFSIDGAIVLNGIAIVAKAAEMAVKLRRLTGTVVSRRGIYAKAPPEAISEFLSAR
jgi:Asp/Glu/hydantoin racemase